MNVYKFGGASVAQPANMLALLPIIQESQSPLVIVLSAKGKTTNLLECIAQHAYNGEQHEALKLAKEQCADHLHYANQLLDHSQYEALSQKIDAYFNELYWAIEAPAERGYDYHYDQIVSMGELLSTLIFSSMLSAHGIANEWIDARDIIRTDDTYRDARIDWDYTSLKATQLLNPILENNKHIVIQGFIGATSDNASVTLGREGSDYTAAVIAAMLGAQSVTIWKDVEGLKNADPKLFSDTVKIEAITFHEVIEMAYYGAQVIHPKTIKPLQNNNIPLYVKCFLNKELKGTLIQNEVSSFFYPPLIILKSNQLLLQVTTKDFSFITEDNLSRIYKLFHQFNTKINLIQNAAISFVACIDNKQPQVNLLIKELEREFSIFINEDVSLLTIRHYSPEVLKQLTKGKYIMLEQKTTKTIQMVIK